MIWHRIFQKILFIFAFNYLVIYPLVLEFDDPIRNDVIYRIGKNIQQKSFKNCINFTFFKLSNNTKNDIFIQSKAEQKLAYFLSPNPTLNLSILSTIRLTL